MRGSPAQIDATHYVTLRKERDQLAERVAQLEAILLDTDWIPGHWRIAWSERLILNLLTLRALATRDALLTVLELSETARPTLRNDADKLGPRNLDVHIHKLRRDLRVAGAPVTIENVKGVGYRLDAAGRLFLTMLMREFAA